MATDKENTLTKKSTYENLWESLKKFLQLKGEDLKLALCETATVLISTLVVTLAIIMLGTAVLLFLSYAVAQWIGASIGMDWAYFIVAGFYLLIIILVVLLRKPLILDPVARFISKVLLS